MVDFVITDCQSDILTPGRSETVHSVMSIASGGIVGRYLSRSDAVAHCDGLNLKAQAQAWSVDTGTPPPTQVLASVFGMGTNYFS